MSKPHANKPFPLSLLEWTKLKARHIFCFWCLCNDFEADEDGWIDISRIEFNRRIDGCLPMKTHNPTIILETLQELEYIQLERIKLDSQNRFSTTRYRIKVRPDSWEPRVVINKTYLQNNDKAKDRRDFYRNRYAERKAAALAAKLLG